MSDITKLQTMKDVFEYIDAKHPGWIIGMYTGYSGDYPELHDNWIKLCRTFKAKPQQIVLIERLELNDHFTFAELLSQTGFVVRTRHEHKIACFEYVIYEYICESDKDYRNENALPALIFDAASFIKFVKDNTLDL